MERFVLQKLKDWKNKPAEKRKPLILEGARQTGKTWLARELGHCEFEEYVEINFEDNEQIRSLFEMDFDIERILMALRSVTGKSIVAGKTLVFFDEIQYARRGLLSLKYFGDKKPELHVIAAGSLLGVIDHKNDSFPVGVLKYYNFLYVKNETEDGEKRTVMIEDWELGMLYWNSLKCANGDEKIACEKVKQKYFVSMLKDTDFYFFMGTTKQWHNVSPNPFVIIGTFYPKKDDKKQLSLF